MKTWYKAIFLAAVYIIISFPLLRFINARQGNEWLMFVSWALHLPYMIVTDILGAGFRIRAGTAISMTLGLIADAVFWTLLWHVLLSWYGSRKKRRTANDSD